MTKGYYAKRLISTELNNRNYSVSVPGSTVIRGKVGLSNYKKTLSFISALSFMLSSVAVPFGESGTDIPGSIRASAFEGCSRMKSVNLSMSFQELWNRAFADCTALASVNIPKSLTTIHLPYTNFGVYDYINNNEGPFTLRASVLKMA